MTRGKGGVKNQDFYGDILFEWPLYKSFVPSLAMDDKKTEWVGKKLIVHLTISVTKWVWTASLTD